MKFQLTFKTPDVRDSISGSLLEDEDMSEDELVKFLSQWLKYEECVTIEFDTVANTAKVV